jgi:hypothetical protein
VSGGGVLVVESCEDADLAFVLPVFVFRVQEGVKGFLVDGVERGPCLSVDYFFDDGANVEAERDAVVLV